ncbi:hypothetical protein BDN71DRAFT_1441111 [Pleurotus eryngii]|uniref:SnoaL-like domain-containing protein n=1 Tax=Pleurotus eryngii TaxID=5323 RepID=A0A9P6A4N0_PLEER|nr:hypothetical protein BDN71DRAFT_1441111 [Pleurotus eryngii]
MRFAATLLSVLAAAGLVASQPGPLRTPRRIDVDYVTKIFKNLESTNTSKRFMDYVDDNVQWTVANPDPNFKSFSLAGLYTSKQDFIVRAEGPVGAALATPLTTEVISEPIVMGNRAIVEMRSRDAGGVNLPRGKNGMLYDNRYAWLVKFDVSTGLIIETHTYMDTAMLAKLLDY